MSSKPQKSILIPLMMINLIIIIKSEITLDILKPKLLKNQFKNGIQFKEIINTHQLLDFQERVDIHLPKSKDNDGCSRFSLDHVNSLIFYYIFYYIFYFIITKLNYSAPLYNLH